MEEKSEPRNQGHVGFAAIVGRPNVGKSTLLNTVLGAKIAIVSQRPQTTRNRILGVSTRGKDQLVLVDTPGIHRRRANLNRFMVQEAMESLYGVDCIILMTEMTMTGQDLKQPKLQREDQYVLEQLQINQVRAPVILAINKVDLLRERALLLPLMDTWRQRGMEVILPISALTGENIEALLQEVINRLPEGDFLFPEETLTDRAERFIVAELIREQVFIRCRQEIPHATAVEIIQFIERPQRNDVCIEAIIHVERESQKAIVIGKGGSMIKAIGSSVRQEISRLLGCPVHVKLVAHVEPNWSKSPRGRRKLGYE